MVGTVPTVIEAMRAARAMADQEPVMKSMNGLVMAAAVAGLFAGVGAVSAESTPSARGLSQQTRQVSGGESLAGRLAANADTQPGKHDCKGKNECKGKGGCKTDKHECKGHNACKGQGGCKTMPEKKGDKAACNGKEGCGAKK